MTRAENTAEHYLCAVFISLSMDGVGATTTPQSLGGNAHLHPWQRGPHGTCEGNRTRVKQWTAPGEQKGCKRAAVLLSMASAACAGTRELPSRGLPFRKASITSYVCMQMSRRCNPPFGR